MADRATTVRRTKADALATRAAILDNAAELFVSQGVARTTLAQIAASAGVTRGAIYWHFADKAALFNAMMERARMPLESAMDLLESARPADPLGTLAAYAALVFRLTETDAQARRVFEIAILKTEYVDDMTAVCQRRARIASRWLAAAEARVALACACGQVGSGIDARAASLGLWALLDGLVRTWMTAPESFGLADKGGRIVGMYLRALRGSAAQ